MKGGRNVEEFRTMLREAAPALAWDGRFVGETTDTGAWTTSPVGKLWFAPASDLWELSREAWRVLTRPPIKGGSPNGQRPSPDEHCHIQVVTDAALEA